MDAWIGAATDAIVEERRRVYQAEQVRIRSAIESLVAAEPVDVDAATRLLRIPLIGWHLELRHRSTSGRCGGAASPGRRRALVRSGSRQRTNAAIRNERGDGSPLGDNRSPAADAPSRGSARAGDRWWSVLANHTLEPDGFRRTFLEASDALRLAASLGDNGGVSYGDAALAIVLSRDEERARWFVEHELRDLAADSPEMADMRNTLRTFFAHADAHRSGS